MHEVQWLAEKTCANRRSIADAIDVLSEAATFSAQHSATIVVNMLNVPGQIVGSAFLQFDAADGHATYCVSLPAARTFEAKRCGNSETGRFDIQDLDGASVDDRGIVTLTDGSALRAVDIIPTRLPYNPSERDWRIVKHTVAILDAEDRCYRWLGEGLPPRYARTFPRALRFLDCSRLKELTAPPLKVLAWELAKRDPTLKNLSLQKIADALRAFGMRIPQLRPRRRHKSAII